MAASHPSGPATDQRLQDLVKSGVPLAEAQAWLDEQDLAEADDEGEGATDDDGPLHIWPQNHQVFRLFMGLQTQWRRKPNGALDGLRYDAIKALMWALGTKKRDRAQLWEQLQDMEREALEASDEQQQQQQH